MNKKIKEVLKKLPLVVTIYEGCVKGIFLLKETEWVKRYTSIGKGNENRDKKFFLINSMLTGGATGLYSATLVVVLPYMNFAIRKGWIPVIDFSGPVKMLLLQDKDKCGVENPWEYYYKQPRSDISLEEVYQSKYVFDGWYWRKKVKHYNWADMTPTDEKTLKYWNKMITSYIKLNDDLEKRIAAEMEKIFKPGQKVLGVGIRAQLRYGAMLNVELYNNHPKQPSCEEMMDIVEAKMRLWGCDHIFISCDDREYFDKFKGRWGEQCYFFKRKRFRFFENDTPILGEKVNVELKNVATRERNEEYIVETYLLAQCNSCYSCHGGGATFAYFLNGGKYEHIEFYEAGIYEGLGK